MPDEDNLDNIESTREYSDENFLSMTDEEIDLRDSINQYLSSRGYHLRLSSLHVTETEYIHNFVEPVDKWFFEFPNAYSMIKMKIHEWQSAKYH